MARRAGPKSDWPFVRKDFMNQSEKRLYALLCIALPECQIFPQVAVSQLIDVRKPADKPAQWRNRIDRLVCDFVVLSNTFDVLLVIEHDGPHHHTPKQRARDQRKDKALASAGIDVKRVPAGKKLEPADIRAWIFPAQQTAISATVPVITPIDPLQPTSLLKHLDQLEYEKRASNRNLLVTGALAACALLGSLAVITWGYTKAQPHIQPGVYQLNRALQAAIPPIPLPVQNTAFSQPAFIPPPAQPRKIDGCAYSTATRRCGCYDMHGNSLRDISRDQCLEIAGAAGKGHLSSP